MKDIAFMSHIPTSQLTMVNELLKKYAIGKYLITAESNPYEHLHFYVETTEDRYNKFRDTVLRKKYKLSGKATEGKARQYGKIKILNDKQRYLSYIRKDNGKYATNMTMTEIDSIPTWTQKIIPGYKYTDYVKEQDRETFVDLLRTEYLEQVENCKYGTDTVEITVKDIAKLWLKNYDKQLPRYDTLLWLCYKAGIMTEDNLILARYGNNHDYMIFNYY